MTNRRRALDPTPHDTKRCTLEYRTYRAGVVLLPGYKVHLAVRGDKLFRLQVYSYVPTGTTDVLEFSNVCNVFCEVNFTVNGLGLNMNMRGPVSLEYVLYILG